jgi:predicted nucleic acid-binding protein
MIHVDTSFLIRTLVRNSPEDRQLRGWLRGGESLGISSVSWAEFLCGPVATSDVALATRIVGEPEPFTSADAVSTARLFDLAGRRRGSLADCMIVATALRAQAPLATSNVADFRRFESAGLRIAGVSQ